MSLTIRAHTFVSAPGSQVRDQKGRGVGEHEVILYSVRQFVDCHFVVWIALFYEGFYMSGEFAI